MTRSDVGFTGRLDRRNEQSAAARLRCQQPQKHTLLGEEERNTTQGGEAPPPITLSKSISCHSKEGRRESNTTHRTRTQQEGEKSSTSQEGQATPLQRKMRQTTPHKSTKGKAASPRRARHRICQRQHQVPKTQATTHITSITEERTPTEPTTPEAQGLDFPTSLAVQKMVIPQEKPKANSRNTTHKKRKKATPPTTKKEDGKQHLPKGGGSPATPPNRGETG